MKKTRKPRPALEFRCDDCGLLPYAIIDGYSFGDRLLEGVPFKVLNPQGRKLQLQVEDSAKEYCLALNMKKWLKAGREFAEDTDCFTCPKCGADILNPLRATAEPSPSFTEVIATDLSEMLGKNIQSADN